VPIDIDPPLATATFDDPCLRRMLAMWSIGSLDDGDLPAACHACVLTADAILQEAFRTDPQGDPALLGQAKAMLRAYLQQARR
jgi:hypothetical protein